MREKRNVSKKSTKTDFVDIGEVDLASDSECDDEALDQGDNVEATEMDVESFNLDADEAEASEPDIDDEIEALEQDQNDGTDALEQDKDDGTDALEQDQDDGTDALEQDQDGYFQLTVDFPSPQKKKRTEFSLPPEPPDSSGEQTLASAMRKGIKPFLVFYGVQFRKLFNQDPNFNLHNARRLKEIWKSLSREEKQPYFKEAERLEQLHQQENTPAWLKTFWKEIDNNLFNFQDQNMSKSPSVNMSMSRGPSPQARVSPSLPSVNLNSTGEKLTVTSGRFSLGSNGLFSSVAIDRDSSGETRRRLEVLSRRQKARSSSPIIISSLPSAVEPDVSVRPESPPYSDEADYLQESRSSSPIHLQPVIDMQTDEGIVMNIDPVPSLEIIRPPNLTDNIRSQHYTTSQNSHLLRKNSSGKPPVRLYNGYYVRGEKYYKLKPVLREKDNIKDRNMNKIKFIFLIVVRKEPKNIRREIQRRLNIEKLRREERARRREQVVQKEVERRLNIVKSKREEMTRRRRKQDLSNLGRRHSTSDDITTTEVVFDIDSDCDVEKDNHEEDGELVFETRVLESPSQKVVAISSNVEKVISITNKEKENHHSRILGWRLPSTDRRPLPQLQPRRPGHQLQPHRPRHQLQPHRQRSYGDDRRQIQLPTNSDSLNTRRAMMNDAERKRRTEIKEQFQELASMLPKGRHLRTPSKVFILQETQNYVKYLQREEKRLREQLDVLRYQQQTLIKVHQIASQAQYN